MNSSPVEEPSSDTMIVRSLFGHSVGSVSSSHSCSYHRQKGKLYISTNCLCYYSNMFGFERKIMIRFGDMKLARLARTTSITLGNQRADDLNDSRDTLDKYTFRSFRDRQHVLSFILDAYKKFVGKDFRNEVNLPNLGDEIEKNGNQLIFSDLDPIRSQKLRCMSHDNEDAHIIRSSRRRINTNESTSSYSFGHSSSGLQTEKEKALERWNFVKEDFDISYDEVAVDSQTISISLTEFYNKFIDDDAPNSIAKFLETVIRDEDVKCTLWDNQISGNEDPERKRLITSVHKRKAKIGPSSVVIERHQVCRKYGSLGFVLSNILKANGMPYSFEMQDKWIFEAIGDQMLIDVRFRIQFDSERSPMSIIRKTIISQTRKEVRHWFELYLKMIHSTLIGNDNLLAKVPYERESRESFFSLFERINLISVFVACVSVVVLYIVFLQQRIKVLEAELLRLEVITKSVTNLLDKIYFEEFV